MGNRDQDKPRVSENLVLDDFCKERVKLTNVWNFLRLWKNISVNDCDMQRTCHTLTSRVDDPNMEKELEHQTWKQVSGPLVCHSH